MTDTTHHSPALADLDLQSLVEQTVRKAIVPLATEFSRVTSDLVADPSGAKQVERRRLDYEQAAEYLSIGKSTLYSLVSEGQLTCVRFGVGKTKKGVTRFRREDLDAFVKARVMRAKR